MTTRLCECGCGQPTSIVTQTSTAEGVRRGEYRRFIQNHHRLISGNEVITKSDMWRGYSRARKIQRADRCEKCGSDGDGLIDRHHKDQNQLNNDPSNIAFLCRQCHREAHCREDLYESCANGHKWTPENTYYQKRRNGNLSRRCRECHRSEQLAYTRRKEKAA